MAKVAQPLTLEEVRRQIQDLCDHPPECPPVKISTAAAMLGINPATVRGWVDRGKIEHTQLDDYMTRYVPIAEVLRIADRLGIIPDLDKLADDL